MHETLSNDPPNAEGNDAEKWFGPRISMRDAGRESPGELYLYAIHRPLGVHGRRCRRAT